ARALLPLAHSMRGWGLDHARFLHALPGWGLLAIAAIALVPRIGRLLDPALERAGAAIARGAAWPYFVFALLALALWLLPDELQFVGDFIVRLGAATEHIPTATLFPQALPLDLLIHYDLPRRVASVSALDVLATERLLGLVEAIAMALLAVRFARALGFAG